MRKKDTKILAFGQPRPYADSIYDALVSVYEDSPKKHYIPITREEAIRLFKDRVYAHWREDPEYILEPRLEICEPVGISPKEQLEKGVPPEFVSDEKEIRWRIRVKAPFTD